MVRRAYYAFSLLLAGCVAGYPTGPPDPELQLDRITVLAVSARVAGENPAGQLVLLTFQVRNDAKKTADVVSVSVTAFKGMVEVGRGMSHDNPKIRVGREAAIGVLLDRPSTLEEFDCYEYEVEALIDGRIGSTAPVRKCLR
jgi:hypothetical protein